MKTLCSIFIAFIIVSPVFSQAINAVETTRNLAEGAIRITAEVVSGDFNYVTLRVDEVIAYSPGVSHVPAAGDEINVKLPGRNKPQDKSLIEVDLKEKIDIGAMPTGYLLLEYKTLQ